MNNSENTGLLKINYTVPNYEQVKLNKNFEQTAKPRIQALEKEAHSLGYKECSFNCGELVWTRIYEDEELNNTVGKACDKCYAKNFHSEPINKPIQEVFPKHGHDDWYSESRPVKIISWGGGKDSTSLILEMGNEVDEIVLCDTGAEEIETYEYIKYFINTLPRQIRDKITIIKNTNLGNIDEWHYDNKMIPMPFANRTCTDKFKLRVIHQYLRRTYGTRAVFDMIVGINYDEMLERERPLASDEMLEQHIKNVLKLDDEKLVKLANRQKISVEDYKERLRNSHQTGTFDKDGKWKGGLQYCRNIYPLCRRKIGREQEEQIFKENNIVIPPKSGCYFCPMKPKAQFEKMRTEHPDQYENVIRMQEHSRSKTINIIGQKEKHGEQMRCSCNNGIYEEDDEFREMEAKMKEREEREQVQQ